ncbi:hypothetical protein [Streptomyces sp. NPDC059761]|uniref:hypothetical protein n=1 Tax=Streptomyces sp. NPDC059761 TaxID=3346937 RepID=UPI00365D5C68
MAKRKPSLVPWPRNVWRTDGVSRTQGLVRAVRQQLANAEKVGAIVSHREFDARTGNDDQGSWWGWDASWRTDDGARIRARMLLGPDAMEINAAGLDRDGAEETSRRISMLWTVTAQADQDWQDSWVAPPLKFLPSPSSSDWAVDPVTQSFALADNTSFGTLDDHEGLLTALRTLSTCPWYTVVLTHDQRTMREAQKDPASALVDLLPPSYLGRVLEIRLVDTQDQWINPILEPFRVSVPWGGSVILPHDPRKAEWSSADYTIPQQVGRGGLERVLQKTALAVAQYTSVPPHYLKGARELVEWMEGDWVLPELDVAAEHVLRLKEEAESDAEALREELRRTKGQLAEEVKSQEEAGREIGALREALHKLREDPLRQQLADAKQLCDSALADSEAAQLLLDDLTGEVGWLRGQLAQVPGRSYGEQAPERLGGPESWKELVDLVDELMPHIRIGDVWGPLEKLRGHKHERVWIRRTWESLEALEAYASAKQEVGAAELPHFTSYLKWPLATSLVPLNLYCASEANLLRNDPRFREMRTFDVPGAGRVFMGEHFRVGGSRPPAPRMHVYDGTGDGTGLIHVGYIGAHLPNGKPV